MKSIILCADDYGLNASISQGIIQLLRHKCLSATSCMVTSPLWPEHASWLTHFHGQADIGLHFNLTEGKPLSPLFQRKYGDFSSLLKVMIAANLRQLEGSIIEHELEAQLDLFAATTGFLPDFIDGHQHVHQFPIIRETLCRIYDRRLRAKNSYIRLSRQRTTPSFKQWVIDMTGGFQFERLLNKHGIPHNEEFAGIYAFADSKRYPEIFTGFLKKVKQASLIMCHPGLQGGDDAISGARFDEYSYLSSGSFAEDCQKYKVMVKRFMS